MNLMIYGKIYILQNEILCNNDVYLFQILPKMKLPEARDNFNNWLEVIKDKSPKTVEQYTRHLEKFSEYLEEQNIDSFSFEVEDITLKLAE